jgi:hypothetical protein
MDQQDDGQARVTGLPISHPMAVQHDVGLAHEASPIETFRKTRFQSVVFPFTACEKWLTGNVDEDCHSLHTDADLTVSSATTVDGFNVVARPVT